MAVLDQIKKTFLVGFQKEWYETYWAIDIHGTIFTPSYNLKEGYYYYPFAKEALQLLSKRKDITMIISTSSFPKDIQLYADFLRKDNIYFDFVNENPGISSKMGNFGYYEDKYYFNVMIEDKAGFIPEIEWKGIYDYLVWCEENMYLPDPEWTRKF